MDSARRMKIDLFMPLEIGRYLQDTAHLSPCQSGAYIHLLMHYWSHGPLPNDMEQLSSIAKMPGDAWSIAYAVIKQFFSIGSDGLLHQAGADRRLEFWTGKKLKANEKASKAAKVRWGKYRAKQEEEKAKHEAKTDAPSIAQAMLEQCPIPVSKVQKQEHLTPTPPATQVGIETPKSSRRSPRAAGTSPRQLGVSPRQLGTSPIQRGASPRQLGTSPRQIKSESKAKAKLDGAPGHLPGSNEGDVSENSSIAVEAGHRSLDTDENGDSGHRKASLIRAAAKSECLAYWAAQNPAHPDYAWLPADDRALDALLGADQTMTLAVFCKLLRNRSRSAVNPSAPFHKWVRGLIQYASGPLGQHGKPIEVRIH